MAARAVELGERLGLPLVRWRGMVDGERLRLYRHPESVDVAATIAIADAAGSALRELDDDLGLSRVVVSDVRPRLGPRATPRRASSTPSARSSTRAAPVSASKWLRGSTSSRLWSRGRTPVSQAVSRCMALESEVVGHRAAELSLLGCRAALSAMAGRADEAREGMALVAGRPRSASGSTRPRRGWPSWTHRPKCSPEIRRWRPAAARDTERITRAIGDRWFLSAALVD